MRKIIFLLLAPLFILSGCGEDSKPQKRAVSPKKPAATINKTALETNGQGQDSLIWPPPAKDQNSITVADTLIQKNYVMIFDGSGSMSGKRCSGERTKSEVAKEAVADWAKSVPADARLGLVAFDASGFSVRLQLGQDTPQQFIEKVEVIMPNGGTPLAKSVRVAYEMLTEQARKQLGYGEYHIVIVTDGVADKPQQLTQTVNKVLRRSPIMISTIGFCIADTHSLHQPGRIIYKAADNPEALRQGLQDVLAESESFDDVTNF